MTNSEKTVLFYAEKYKAFFVLTVLSLIAVLVTANTVATVSVQNTSGGQMESLKQSNLKYLTDKIDEAYSTAYSLAYKISNYNTIKDYAKSTSRNYFTEYEIRMYLESICSSNSYIDMCYIYFPQYEYVISSIVGLNDKAYYSRYYNTGYEEWLDMLDIRTNSFLLEGISSPETTGQFDKCFIKFISNNPMIYKSAVVVVQINGKTFSDIMGLSDLRQNEGLIVFDSAGVVTSSFSKDEDTKIYDNLLSGMNSSNPTITINDTVYKIERSVSDKNKIMTAAVTTQSASGGNFLFIRYLPAYITFIFLISAIALIAVIRPGHSSGYLARITAPSVPAEAESTPAKKVPDWVSESLKIIEQNYWDKNLSTTYIAEKLNLTRPYLSSCYKEHTGRGLHDEIQMRRITEAKILLREQSDIKIAELSDRVGFTSVVSFNRNLKKYEDITPGQLKAKYQTMDCEN